MDMRVYFPGNLRVAADVGGFTVETDQPLLAGGDETAPAPFSLFLASVGTCAGIYVLSFLKQRGFEPADASLRMSTTADPLTGMVSRIDIDVDLPEGFPEKYRTAVVRAVNQCAVKKHLQQPPEFNVRALVSSGSERVTVPA